MEKVRVPVDLLLDSTLTASAKIIWMALRLYPELTERAARLPPGWQHSPACPSHRPQGPAARLAAAGWSGFTGGAMIHRIRHKSQSQKSALRRRSCRTRLTLTRALAPGQALMAARRPSSEPVRTPNLLSLESGASSGSLESSLRIAPSSLRQL